MAKVYTIEPNPHWVIIDNFSKLPNGAAIYTFKNTNPSEFKPAFEDAAGTVPYGQYIQGLGNGTMPPIFWEFDDAAPAEGYYIRVYDRPKTEPGAQFLWEFNNLFGGGTGGGGTVTTLIDIGNLVVNGEFYSNCGDLPTSGSSVPALITLAPSNNAGFVGMPQPATPSDGPVAPDIIFAKSNTTATDTLTFKTASPLGVVLLSNNPTPQIFVNYTCSVGGSGETYKFLQIPLVKGLQNTSGQQMGCQIFARLNSGTNDVTFAFRQFFGNGGAPSADVITPIGGGPLALDTTFKRLSFSNVLVPSISGKTLGSCGNDALYLQIRLPLSPETINLDLILPAVYLGGVASSLDFHTQDEVDAIVNSPRTGDVRFSLNNVRLGWLAMNDGTIGNASSNATRANVDTFPLFKLLWDTFSGSQSLAPMLTSGGSPVAYGADAVADFTANRQLTLTVAAGRVIAGVSGSHLLGTSGGSETHTMTPAELVAHQHVVRIAASDTQGAQQTLVEGSAGVGFVSTATEATGSSMPFSIVQPTVYNNLFIKL